MNEISPVLLFSYNRLNELKATVNNLKSAKLANETILYLFSDGPRSFKDSESVEQVRDFLKSIDGFKKVIYKFSESNKGLASSILDGVSEVLETHNTVIVLEDDLLVSSNFLEYMNKALNYYEHNENISSICGFNNTISVRKSKEYPYDMFFAKRSSSWGWGTWKKKWIGIDWEVKDFSEFSQNKPEIKEFNSWGSDMYSMLKRQQNGEVDSWAIRYSYHQHKNKLWSVFPLVSKVKNIGFNDNATNTKQSNKRYDVHLDITSEIDFNFMKEIKLNQNIIAEFKALNSIKNRVKYKVLNFFRFQ
ncbi:glycosyltransferase [Maribacter sp. BPC-D8]|uniref:glycosyltransferase n=1 Tax=Maribacter sp. BPC-D8 TaxID=3053613 RepID=UPI002B466855|nr:glycosyltransferase [Maribacter sp. BPC-D8]WRI28345.1 glycosyltransferase [Maribacter sp. BPC-D8]